jgi:pyruvate/2-oxoglutarate dehydrogenase complex dihydrolipoamide acyltransferase (E2) component
VTYDATEDGYITKILVGTGEVKGGQPMMITVDDAKDVAAFASYTVAAPAAAPTPAPAAPKPIHVTAPAATAVAPSLPAASVAAASSGSRVPAPPSARKLLRDAGLRAQALEVISFLPSSTNRIVYTSTPLSHCL